MSILRTYAYVVINNTLFSQDPQEALYYQTHLHFLRFTTAYHHSKYIFFLY